MLTQAYRGLSHEYSGEHSDVGVRVYVTNDSSEVHENKFYEVARDDAGRIRPTLILLGIRLGIDRVTAVYWDSLKEMITYPQSVGIAG
jgi:cysteine protease ATG4